MANKSCMCLGLIKSYFDTHIHNNINISMMLLRLPSMDTLLSFLSVCVEDALDMSSEHKFSISI